tara:strand:+ start:1507 stop:2235 length:729 start_codon:yes stop_codon:yes gene_type:complete
MPESYDSKNYLSYNHLVTDDNIQNLQHDSINKDAAFDSLGKINKIIEGEITDSSFSNNKRKNNVKKLNEINVAKQNMLTELDTQVSVLQDRFNNTNTNKINQQANLNIVNSEIKKTKDKNEYYNSIITDKVRNMQINTFYQKKYESQISLLKFIIVICIVIIFVSIIKRRGLLSEGTYGGIIGLIIFFSILRVSYLMYDIFIRDKNNFDEVEKEWVLTVYGSESNNSNADNVDDSETCSPSE